MNLDVGCGNGKYLGVGQGLVNLGTDRSEKLLEICKGQGFEVFTANGLKLPMRGGVFDSVITIAVVHHLATAELRVAALKECARVLKKGGRLLVYVWALEQEGRQFEGQDVFVP